MTISHDKIAHGRLYLYTLLALQSGLPTAVDCSAADGLDAQHDCSIQQFPALSPSMHERVVPQPAGTRCPNARPACPVLRPSPHLTLQAYRNAIWVIRILLPRERAFCLECTRPHSVHGLTPRSIFRERTDTAAVPPPHEYAGATRSMLSTIKGQRTIYVLAR